MEIEFRSKAMSNNRNTKKIWHTTTTVCFEVRYIRQMAVDIVKQSSMGI